MGALNYSSAGVDRNLADRFVDQIQILSRETLNKKVKAAVGGYASVYELDKEKWIAASTDGVGTKLKLAFKLGDHRTVGIDLVAMSVNDILCVGAEPLFFLDYFAAGKLDSNIAHQVLTGIVEGCKQAQCALVGGETAEMPDFYTSGEYDLAGFAVGSLSPSQYLPKKEVRSGDILIGIASSGCHSNGYSLIRKAIDQSSRFKNDKALLRELLTPTKIYVKALLPLIRKNALKGLAHITGSGFLNVPRISEKVSYEIQLPPAAERPAIYQWIQKELNLSFEEQAQTFNLGIGMVVAVDARKASHALRQIKRSGENAWIIGEVTKRRPGKKSEVLIADSGMNAGSSVTLEY